MAVSVYFTDVGPSLFKHGFLWKKVLFVQILCNHVGKVVDLNREHGKCLFLNS